MIRRTILEWERIEYGEDVGNPRTIPVAVADRIAAVASASALAGAEGGGVIEHGRRGLRARGVVGVIAHDDCVLEILPKIENRQISSEDANNDIRSRLVHMLAVALDIKIDTGQLTALASQKQSLLEVLIRLFAEKLLDAVRQGMPRRYMGHEEDLPALRGRLDVTRQFSLLAANPSRLACRFDALSADIALNQIMKAAVLRLSRISRSVESQRQLRELSFVYTEICEVPISALRWNDVILDRTNARWKELLTLARLLLGERYQTTSHGGSQGYSLLFSMSSLFEEYVGRLLRRALAGRNLRVVTQGGRRYCLTHENGGLFQTRPDILIKSGDDVVQVIDTKWKRISAQVDDKKRGVSQSDVYQMMAYGRLYCCGRLTLLYPHHLDLPEEDGMQVWHGITNSDHRLEVATVDLSRLDGIESRLRAMHDHGVS